MFPSSHSMIVSLISTMIVLITMLILTLILTSMIRMDITGWCFLITLRSTTSLLLKPWPIEIVELPIKNGDFPIKNGDSPNFPIKHGGSFHRFFYVYQAGFSLGFFIPIGGNLCFQYHPAHHGWWIYTGKSQSKMDENWGYPYDLGYLQMMSFSLVIVSPQFVHNMYGL